MLRIATVGLVGLWLMYFVPSAIASDPVGVYAVIERVEFEPTAAQPERVRLYGWFALSDVSRGAYKEPQHGWLCYNLPAEKQELCRREWKDMEDLAGSGKCVAFGRRHSELGKVAEKKEKASPVEYSLASGLFAVRSDTEYHIVRNLVAKPLAASPADDSLVPPGRAELTALNTRDAMHQHANYVFDLIELKSGARLRSDPIPAGDRETTWSSKMRLKPGERYKWKVEAVDGEWRVSSAETEFTVKGLP